MSKLNIHPTAVIEKGVKVGQNVTVEPYAVIKSGVILEDNVVIMSHVYLAGNTTVGEGSVIFPSASIGTQPQDLKFKGEKTYVRIGKNCRIREFVTINTSSGSESIVEIGDDCFIMAYCHIAHNCVLGNNVIMGNQATLAGHVILEPFSIVGGLSAVHQFVRVGTYAMVGGMSRITHDVPPYTLGGGVPFKFGGLNRVGLMRHGFPLEVRRELSRAFRLLYRSDLRPELALERTQEELKPLAEIKHWINFCKATKRGLMGMQGRVKMKEEDLIFSATNSCKESKPES